MDTSEKTDLLQQVVQHMTRLNVPGLPRNYDLFHEALGGHNPALSRDVAALSARPPQSLLDHIGLKHRLASHCGAAVVRANTEVSTLLSSAGQQLALGISAKRMFVSALETVAHSLEDGDAASLSVLMDETGFLNRSLADLISSETDLGQKLADICARVSALEKAARSARTVSLRDRLTGLANRAAFVQTLDTLYDEGTALPGAALAIADIDDFAAINLQFGAATGNTLLKRLAAILRDAIKKNDLVARTGGDEFSFLFSDVTAEAAGSIAARLRASVENNLIFASESGGNDRITLSIGIALCDGASSPAEAQAQAEQALAAARANPRAPVVVWSTGLGHLPGRYIA